MATEATNTLSADPEFKKFEMPPTAIGPLTVSVTPEGICVTCQAVLGKFVYVNAVMVVLTLTTLLMVVTSGPVPVGLKTALSDAPGFPVLGFQFALMFQLLAPGLATFQTNVV